MQVSTCQIELNERIQPPWLPSRSFIAPLVDVDMDAHAIDTAEVMATAHIDGKKYPVVTKGDDGHRINFDIEKTIEVIRTEQYPGAELAIPSAAKLPFDYSKLPMSVVGMAAKAMYKQIDKSKLPPYPAWPLDHSADILYSIERNDKKAQPLQWPDEKKYAFALTHDVDTDWVFRNRKWFDAFTSVEEKHGFRSAWYAVPMSSKSRPARAGLAELVNRGHEVGIHGVTHDPCLADLPHTELVGKLTTARDMMSDFCVDQVGYRAPWLSRSESLYEALRSAGFLYDTTRPTANFERNNAKSNNGCGTLFPFRDHDIVELPITLPQDCIQPCVGKSPEAFWQWVTDVLEMVRSIGGIAVVTTHIQPHHSANGPMLAGYEKLLQEVARHNDVFNALPRDIAAYAKPLLKM